MIPEPAACGFCLQFNRKREEFQHEKRLSVDKAGQNQPRMMKRLAVSMPFQSHNPRQECALRLSFSPSLTWTFFALRTVPPSSDPGSQHVLSAEFQRRLRPAA